MKQTKMETMVKIEGLKKKYGEFTAVDGLNFDIFRNEILGLLGPNGAGKTTTISMICGLLQPSEGKITFDDHHGKDRKSLIMLMFTASIAFVSEVENKTIIRLKLSKLTTFEFLGGISVVQLIVGIVSVLLTLITAILLGFNYSGSLTIMIIIASMTSLSIIAFSLIIAAVTKSANEVLVVGNFPMFLFMFFTGAAFPLKSETLFTIAGYPINIQGLMTPTHAISALNKTLIMNMHLSDIIPEIISIIVLTLLYFIIGGIIFKQRHLKLT